MGDSFDLLSVIINAQLQTGIRQGCPLSPLLFGSEILTRLFQEAFNGLKMGVNADSLTHLLFADDVLVWLATSPLGNPSSTDTVPGLPTGRNLHCEKKDQAVPADGSRRRTRELSWRASHRWDPQTPPLRLAVRQDHF